MSESSEKPDRNGCPSVAGVGPPPPAPSGALSTVTPQYAEDAETDIRMDYLVLERGEGLLPDLLFAKDGALARIIAEHTEAEVKRLTTENKLLKVSNAGVTSVLLDVQQDCIALKKQRDALLEACRKASDLLARVSIPLANRVPEAYRILFRVISEAAIAAAETEGGG